MCGVSEPPLRSSVSVLVLRINQRLDFVNFPLPGVATER
jgi:hypothetical protein